MTKLQKLPGNLAAVLTFGRPVLVFGAFACALWVMFTHYPPAYMLGLSFLILSMLFDWIDGWFAVRFIPHSRLGPLVDRMMERMVYAIIYPVLGAGMIWRLNRLSQTGLEEGFANHQLHALFVVAIGVLVLMRNQFANFLISFAHNREGEVESFELNRLRTFVAAPMAVLLYAYAFYLPTDGWESFYRMLDWLDQVPLRVLFVVESLFLIINIVSLTGNIRNYGMLAVDDICEDDEILRRRILSVFPNTITLMNGAMGAAAVVFANFGRVREATFILLGAAFFDKLDGTLARRLGLTQPLGNKRVTTGALLDDFSDLISFCLAPAAIYYTVMTAMPPGVADGLPHGMIALTYALAGSARLVYFTLDKNPIPGFFKGMPVPAGALMVIGPVEIAGMMYKLGNPDMALWGMIAAGTMVTAALAMNLYPVRFLHFGRLMGRHPAITWGLALLSLVLVFTPYLGLALMALTGIYLISPVFTRRIDPRVAAVESRAPNPKTAKKFR